MSVELAGLEIFVKVLIVDDHALFRAGLRMLLSTIGQGVECLECAGTAEALDLIQRHPDVDICLLDLALKKEHGLEAIQRIKAAAPHVSVVIVSGAEESATIKSCVDAGAMSFIPKSVMPEVLTKALQQVLAGNVYLPEQIVSAIEAAPQRPLLTPRQMQVLGCLSRGLPTKLIARELEITENTVKEYIALVFQALGARNRTEAVIIASKLRLAEQAVH